MMNRYLLYLQVALAVIFAGGCGTNRRYAPVAGDDHPWIEPERQARAYISTKHVGSNSTTWVEWTDNEGHVIAESLTVLDRARDFLQDAGDWESLTVVVRQAPDESRFQNPNLKPGQTARELAYATVKVIVSLDPIVVVIGPGPIAIGNTYGAEVEGWTQSLTPRRILLPYGFAEGTLVPYSPSPLWFSPDLNVPPTQVETNSDGERVITVPWGELVLRREGANWRVLARGNKGSG